MTRRNETADTIDILVGAKVSEYRLAKGMGRNALGKLIGISGEQLRKYESGQNRISAGRLALISRSLNIELSRFFLEKPTEQSHRERLMLEGAKNFAKLNEPTQATVNVLMRKLAGIR